jgi:hypothetical protein
MAMRRKTMILVALAAALILAGLCVVLVRGARRGGRAEANFDDVESEVSPIGGIFDRMQRVSRLKEHMGELRAVWLALNQFAQGHQGLLPTNLVELKPYLPTNLASLSDERWEMPSGGMVARPLMERNDAVLLQQKNLAPGRPRIVVFGDGHIEYRK